jgi:hypothetical protein
MIQTLVRYKSNQTTTLGKLYINGQFECYILEDEYREKKIKGETRIPCGTYRLDLRVSPRFSPRLGHKVIWLKDVPNFEFILVHPGNTEKDTDGCLLTGKAVDGWTVTESRAAYEAYYSKTAPAIDSGKPCYLTVIDMDR